MKKLIENIISNLSHTLKALRIFVVSLGVIGVLLSCAPAAENGGVGRGAETASPLSVDDIEATFGDDTADVLDIQISGTNVTIAGFKNYRDSLMLNGSNLEFSLQIADTTSPAEFTVSSLDSLTLTNGTGDLVGIGEESISLGNFTVTVMANNEVVEYSVTVQFDETFILSAEDITATFGSVEGMIQISETDITIFGLRNYTDSLGDVNDAALEFSIAIADVTNPAEFTVDYASLMTTLTNGTEGLTGTNESSVELGVFTVTVDNRAVEYRVTVQFGGGLELRVSGQVELSSTTGEYISIMEGETTTVITGTHCSDNVFIFQVYKATTLSGYTTRLPAPPSPYFDSNTPANNTNQVTVRVLNGSDGVTTFEFSYVVMSCGSGNIVGDGSLDTPYQIPSATTLNLVSELVNAGTGNFRSTHYEVTADIDLGLAGALWAEGEGFAPIGKDHSTAFIGSFNCNPSGTPYTLSNLFINRDSTDNVGLIGFLGSGGMVKNCTLVNAEVTGNNKVGVLVGFSERGDISGSTATGLVNGGDFVGGLVGDQMRGTISDSTATVSVTGNNKVGGLVGFSEGTINSSTVEGAITVSGTGNDVGGLVGSSLGTINGSSATGTVMGNSNVGGLVGNDWGNVTNSIATGDVTGGGNVGGLIGNLDSLGDLVTSYATGSARGTVNVGGLVGTVSNGTITNVYSRGTVSLSSGSETSTGGLIGSILGMTSINNSYTVSEGGHYSFVGNINITATLTVVHSYAGGTSSNSTLAPSSINGLSQETKNDLKDGTNLYTNWNTPIWDFGTSSQLPALKTTPGGAAAQTARD